MIMMHVIARSGATKQSPYSWHLRVSSSTLPLLLDIIQQKPFQVNHQYEAKSEKQEREV